MPRISTVHQYCTAQNERKATWMNFGFLFIAGQKSTDVVGKSALDSDCRRQPDNCCTDCYKQPHYQASADSMGDCYRSKCWSLGDRKEVHCAVMSPSAATKMMSTRSECFERTERFHLSLKNHQINEFPTDFGMITVRWDQCSSATRDIQVLLQTACFNK